MHQEFNPFQEVWHKLGFSSTLVIAEIIMVPAHQVELRLKFAKRMDRI